MVTTELIYTYNVLNYTRIIIPGMTLASIFAGHSTRAGVTGVVWTVKLSVYGYSLYNIARPGHRKA